jgi:predicted nucleic acid-binding protein
MNAVDTNVLIYAQDPRDPRKQAIAAELIESLTDVFLPWQVACEFVANWRKLAPFGVTARAVLDELNGLLLVWKTRSPSFPLVVRATELIDSRQLSLLGCPPRRRLPRLRRHPPSHRRPPPRSAHRFPGNRESVS